MNYKPLITFCFNTDGDIWEQDMWNNQLFNRVHDVNAERTNQIQPFPEQTIHEVCHARVQRAQDELDLNCCNPDGGRMTLSKRIDCPIKPDDHYTVKSKYSSHYIMNYPKHKQINIRDIDKESELKTLGVPLTYDCLTIDETRCLEDLKSNSNRQIYRGFHKTEVDKSCYPNLDIRMFHNTTKEIHNTIDDRNKFKQFL